MLDFTSALYLGLHHPSSVLQPWDRLTLGVPAALEELPGSAELAARVAQWVGGERGLLATSTLHAFWDLFGVLLSDRVSIHSDEGSYPVAQWAIQRAVVAGVPAQVFAHHSPEALERALSADAFRRAPVVVTDGFCPGCGRMAPLAEYLSLTRARGGLLVIDDTQAAGLFGDPVPGSAYGLGGGGSARACGVTGPEVVWCASFAKALGVPMTAVVGSAEWIARMEDEGEARVHCSPPSAAHVAALLHALDVNARCGDLLRRRLAERVALFRSRLADAGLSATGGLFPVQRLAPPSPMRTTRLHARLLRRGVKTVPQRARCGPQSAVAFLVNAQHGVHEMELAAQAVVDAMGAGVARTAEH